MNIYVVLFSSVALLILFSQFRKNRKEDTRWQKRKASTMGIYFAEVETENLKNISENKKRWSEGDSNLRIKAFAVSAGIAYLGYSVTQNFLVSLLVWLASFPAAIFVMKKRKRALEVEQLEKSLPEALDVFARAIAAGVPVERSIQNVHVSFEGPISEEFGRIHDSLSLGLPMQTVLQDSASRVESESFRYFASILSLNTESGGSMVEVLSNLAISLREREKLKRKLAALTAEPRTAARVVTGIPLVLLGIQFAKQPDQLDFFFNTQVGQQIFGLSVASIVFGLVIIRRLTKVI